MFRVFREIFAAVRLLVPTAAYRWQLVGLVTVAALIPISELLVAKLFTDLVISGSEKGTSSVVIQMLLFSALFLATRTINYIQKTYRVKFFDKAFVADTRERSATKESWEWALGLELVNVLTFLTQMTVISGFLFALSPVFASLSLAVTLIVIQAMGIYFKRQLKLQRGFVEKKRAKKPVTPAERLGSRIKHAEIATLLGSGFVVLLLGVLVWFAISGQIGISSAIVIFLALRIQNTTFSSTSSALMRFARAKANSF